MQTGEDRHKMDGEQDLLAQALKGCCRRHTMTKGCAAAISGGVYDVGRKGFWWVVLHSKGKRKRHCKAGNGGSFT